MLNRKIRNLAVTGITTVSATALAAVLATTGASGAVSRTQAPPSAPDPYAFQTAGSSGAFITGDTHGGDFYLGPGTWYDVYSKGGGWYELSAGNNCWNAVPKATSPVGEDSCQGADHNEWFRWVPYNGYFLLIQASSGLRVTAVDGKLDLDAGGGPAFNYEWTIYKTNERSLPPQAESRICAASSSIGS